MRIALCDDQAAERAHIQRMAEEWAAARRTPVSIDSYPNAEAFLFAYETDRHAEVLLLDIQMPGMDGVALAKHVRGADGHVQILFITGHADYMAEGYEVDALQYLLKPVDRDKLFAALDKAALRLKRAEPVLLTESEGESVRVRLKDLLYAEALSHRTCLHLTDGRCIHTKRTLAELAASLPEGGFFRCHRSFLVNLAHVERIGKADIVLAGGDTVLLSRRLYHQAHRAFIQYYKGGGACGDL